MKRQYVKALDQYYTWDADNGRLNFDDGIAYTGYEAILLAEGKPCDEDIRAVHTIKKIFDGQLVGAPDPDPWVVPHPKTEVQKSCPASVLSSMARKRFKSGRSDKSALNGNSPVQMQLDL
jgi:hypothetical protein